MSLSGLRYAVFAGDEKTLTLSEKGSRSRDLQDSIVSLYRVTETSLKPETVLETTPSCLTWLNEVNTVQKKKITRAEGMVTQPRPTRRLGMRTKRH